MTISKAMGCRILFIYKLESELINLNTERETQNISNISVSDGVSEYNDFVFNELFLSAGNNYSENQIRQLYDSLVLFFFSEQFGSQLIFHTIP